MKRILVISVLLLLSNLTRAQPKLQAAGGAIVLGQYHIIQSAELQEQRRVNIYLPESYGKADTARYPVIYLLDGGLDEDFIHIVGLVQFSAMPWVGRIPESIIVGIENKDRKRDMTFPTTVAAEREAYPTTGGSAKFIAFLEQELQPYVQQQYRTTGVSTIIGQSLGGLLATEVLFTKPGLFNNYIIVSPSLWWDGGSLLHRPLNLTSLRAEKKINVYIGTGKEGETPGTTKSLMEEDAKALAEKLSAANSSRVAVFFDYLANEDHASILHQAVYNAIRTMQQH